MDKHDALIRQIRERVSKFLQRGDTRELRTFVRRVEENGGRVALFGGTVRDLVLQEPPRYPRDIDLVIECEDLSVLHSFLVHPIVKRTRFGGIRTYMSGYIVDAWAVRDTWGFKHISEKPELSALPLTTFLNAEAVAVELTDAPNGGRRVYDSGFFDAVSHKRLEINLAANPYPELCAVRALHLAHRTGFRLGSRLLAFTRDVICRSSVESLAAVQLQHYRRVVLDPTTIRRLQSVLESGDDDISMAVRGPVQGVLPLS